jgi:hypothetical protein
MSIGAPSPVNELRVRSCTALAPSEAEGVTVCVRVVSARALRRDVLRAHRALLHPFLVTVQSGACGLPVADMVHQKNVTFRSRLSSVHSCTRNCNKIHIRIFRSANHRHSAAPRRVRSDPRTPHLTSIARCDGRQAEAKEHRPVGALASTRAQRSTARQSRI